ncbi:MAG TPA: tetratricopeptide repeat protein [Chitinophagaceae bacterium]|jgi:tetratricopeptide (TPR) repeat protein|nr:tetratricopeptide repeat protein [Chitinophagaceae bacterium]MBP9739244.1 tetratricopeptide repeat protein [Chitinophagaceae bacterium]HPH22541.1 tetratricopeptide repeat protein [Chitinophagaceae bacterium]
MKYFISIGFICCLVFCSCKESIKDNVETGYPTHINELIQLTQKYPDSINLAIKLVNALDSAGLYKEAIEQVNNLIKTDSLNFGFWNAKAHLQENAKDTIGAILSYKRAIRVYAAPEAMLTLANLYAETKNDSAILLCNSVNALSADKKYTADCKFIEGIYFARIGNTNKALDLFDECIVNSYTYMVAYLEKGFIYYDKKQFKEALEIFTLAATVSNAYADAYYWQAKCYEAMNNKKDALVNYEKALTLDKNLTEAELAIKRLKVQN